LNKLTHWQADREHHSDTYIKKPEWQGISLFFAAFAVFWFFGFFGFFGFFFLPPTWTVVSWDLVAREEASQSLRTCGDMWWVTNTLFGLLILLVFADVLCVWFPSLLSKGSPHRGLCWPSKGTWFALTKQGKENIKSETTTTKNLKNYYYIQKKERHIHLTRTRVHVLLSPGLNSNSLRHQILVQVFLFNLINSFINNVFLV